MVGELIRRAAILQYVRQNMAQKQIHLAEIGPVTLQKRKGSRSIRLTVGHDGVLKVTMPMWSPYKVGEAFALSKRDWIVKQQAGKARHVFNPNERVGKGHRIRFVHEHRDTITSRITKTELIIRLPFDKEPADDDVQSVVHSGAVRALKQEAKNLLPQRLQSLAKQHGFAYRSVSVKRLKSRWGSCSSQKDIALNCFLMQLPWELIDYVLLHELLHTRVMAHGDQFWSELAHYVSDLPAKRKIIKTFQPTLIAQD